MIAFRFERPWWMHAAWLAWPLVPLLAWLIMRPRRRRSLARAWLVKRRRDPTAAPA